MIALPIYYHPHHYDTAHITLECASISIDQDTLPTFLDMRPITEDLVDKEAQSESRIALLPDGTHTQNIHTYALWKARENEKITCHTVQLTIPKWYDGIDCSRIWLSKRFFELHKDNLYAIYYKVNCINISGHYREFAGKDSCSEFKVRIPKGFQPQDFAEEMIEVSLSDSEESIWVNPYREAPYHKITLIMCMKNPIDIVPKVVWVNLGFETRSTAIEKQLDVNIPKEGKLITTFRFRNIMSNNGHTYDGAISNLIEYRKLPTPQKHYLDFDGTEVNLSKYKHTVKTIYW